MNQGLRQTEPFPAHPAMARLTGAAVNEGVILEPSDRDPRLVPRGNASGPQVKGRTIPTPGHIPATVRPAPGQGLRLLPLSGFFWGGPLRGRHGPGLGAPTPRVRGDHVILLVREGSVGIELPRQQHPLRDGQLACIPVGTAFALRPPADVSGWALLIPTQRGLNLPVALPQEFRMGLPDDADVALIEPALSALGQAHLRGPVPHAETACHLGLLALALTRLRNEALPPGLPDRVSLDARPLTDRFLTSAASQLGQNRTVAEFARDLGCTLAELDDACHQSRGRSALDLIYALRFERSVELLRKGSMPITQVAQELGYSGLGHFIRAFSAATGRSPQAFRDCVQHGGHSE